MTAVLDAISASEARTQLALDWPEFRLARQLGEIRADADGRIATAEIERLRAAPDFPDGLRSRLAEVGTREGAELLGVAERRFCRLARSGCFRPVRWYVNHYKAVVWRYLAVELREFAAGQRRTAGGPGWRRRRDPAGTDRRGRGWRTRRVEQLLRDAGGPWQRAAVWAALLGHEVAGPGDALAVHESAYLARLLPAIPVGSLGRPVDLELISSVRTAQEPDEVAVARAELSAAVTRARVHHPAPLLIASRAAASTLGCRVTALPRAYQDAPVPQDVLDRWHQEPPTWLRATRLDAMAEKIAAALGADRSLIRCRISSAADPELTIARWRERPPPWLRGSALGN